MPSDPVFLWKLPDAGFASLGPCRPLATSFSLVWLILCSFSHLLYQQGRQEPERASVTLPSPGMVCLARLSLFCEQSCNISSTVQRTRALSDRHSLFFPRRAPLCYTMLSWIAQSAGLLPSSPLCLISFGKLCSSAQFIGSCDNR